MFVETAPPGCRQSGSLGDEAPVHRRCHCERIGIINDLPKRSVQELDFAAGAEPARSYACYPSDENRYEKEPPRSILMAVFNSESDDGQRAAGASSAETAETEDEKPVPGPPMAQPGAGLSATVKL